MADPFVVDGAVVVGVVVPDEVFVVVVVLVVDVLVPELVVAGRIVRVTGSKTLPPLEKSIYTLVVYVPAAKPDALTESVIWVVLLMVPAPGESESQAALSVAVQVA